MEFSERWLKSINAKIKENGVKQKDIAEELETSPQYVCTVLSGAYQYKNPKYMRRFEKAVDTIIERSKK